MKAKITITFDGTETELRSVKANGLAFIYNIVDGAKTTLGSPKATANHTLRALDTDLELTITIDRVAGFSDENRKPIIPFPEDYGLPPEKETS